MREAFSRSWREYGAGYLSATVAKRKRLKKLASIMGDGNNYTVQFLSIKMGIAPQTISAYLDDYPELFQRNGRLSGSGRPTIWRLNGDIDD